MKFRMLIGIVAVVLAMGSSVFAWQEVTAEGAAGNFDAARTAVGELRSTCQPCHQQYRERDADNNWQIKSGS